jgi:hypothetical protein
MPRCNNMDLRPARGKSKKTARSQKNPAFPGHFA